MTQTKTERLALLKKRGRVLQEEKRGDVAPRQATHPREEAEVAGAFECDVDGCDKSFPKAAGLAIHKGRSHKTKKAPPKRDAMAAPAVEEVDPSEATPATDGDWIEAFFDTQNEMETVASLAHLSDESLTLLQRAIPIIRRVRRAVRAQAAAAEV